jgi:hypothetical protein
MGNRDSWFMASTLVAGCVFLGPDLVRAGSTERPSDSARIEQMEKCDAIQRRYADLARQLAERAKQIANDADRAERLVPARYIPTQRWQADYDTALLLNDQSIETYRLGDAAFQRCSETATRGLPRADARQPRRSRTVPAEAP